MAKKKQTPNQPTVKVTEPAVNTEPPEEHLPSPSTHPVAAAPSPASPAEALQEVLEAITTHMEAQDQALTTLSKRLDARTNAIAARVDDKPEPQPQKMNPMEIFKTITDLLNSPIVQKLSDKLLGGAEETATAPSMNEEYMKYLEARRNKQDVLFDDYQTAIIDGLKLSNQMKKRELESEW